MGPNDREGLKNLSQERIVLPPEFAIHQDVIEAAREWPLSTTLKKDKKFHFVCDACTQSIGLFSTENGIYDYSSDEFIGMKLAHLMQRHGWTRETVSEQ